MKRHKLTLNYNLTLQLDGKWRLQVWTSETENMTPSIFVYQRKPNMPYDESTRDIFVNIAQPADITEYPVDDPNDTFPFFRKACMDITIEDSKLVQDTMDNIGQDAEDLCKALDRIQ